MKQHHLIFIAIVSFSLAACSGQSFPGSQLLGGLGSKESRPIPLTPLKPVTNTINIRKAWQVNTGSASKFSKTRPYISGETIYVAGNNIASAWHKNTAKPLWKINVGEIISAGVNGGANNQLFIGTSNGNAISLDARNGKILWIERLNSEILSVSRAHDNRVVFRTIDGKLHGLTSNTGEIIWQQSQPTPALSLYGASVPQIIGNSSNSFVISGFDNGKIAAYSLQNGSPVWVSTLAEPRGQSELDRMVDIDGKMKVMGKALFANSLNGNNAGISLKNGQLAWAKSFSSATGIDADPQGLYSSDTTGNVWKFQPLTGLPVWKMDDLKRYEPTTPILFNSSLLVVGDKKGNLHWINTTTGKFVGRVQGDPAGYSVAPLVAGNAVYALGKSGVLTKLVLQ